MLGFRVRVGVRVRVRARVRALMPALVMASFFSTEMSEITISDELV